VRNMPRKLVFHSALIMSGFLIGLLTSESVLSQVSFYQGKTISMVLASDAGGAADLRVKAFIGVLRKHIPGNPSIVMQYVPGGGGRKAANHVFGSARPDGLTIGAMLGGLVSSAVLGETGVLYDLDRFIYLGSPDSATQYVFFTRSNGDLNSVEKLRTAHGVRIGSQNVGSWSHTIGRTFAYLTDMKEPKFVTGYSGPELDVALARGEVDGRANTADTVVRRNQEWIEKKEMTFHAILEIPKGNKHPGFPGVAQFESFAANEKDQKLVAMLTRFRQTGLPYVLPPGTPKDRVQVLQEATRKTFEDPEFSKEYRKLAGEEPTPLTADGLEKAIKALPREPQIIDLFKQLSGTGALPAR
jgi:tripartite-type tricarboxylate transporter receptor subunit TctC